MSCFVIGGGSSVNLYPKGQIRKLAESCFTFTVNNSCFHFPSDVIVATDFQWVIDNKVELKKLGKPIITREWAVLSSTNLDYIILPNEVTLFCRLSGMVAAKISDSLAGSINEMSYVIGLDGTKGHYYDDAGDAGMNVAITDYGSLCMTNTINLGGSKSLIDSWPKERHLPKVKVMSSSDRIKCATIVYTLSRELIKQNL